MPWAGDWRRFSRIHFCSESLPRPRAPAHGRMANSLRFERACEELARETNQEHLDAQDGSPFAKDEVVLAAGQLCAILLLNWGVGLVSARPG